MITLYRDIVKVLSCHYESTMMMDDGDQTSEKETAVRRPFDAVFGDIQDRIGYLIPCAKCKDGVYWLRN